MARLTDRRRIAALGEMDPMAPAGGRPVPTDDNVDRIAAVLADPATAWHGEPTARKIAHARQHGVTMPADADADQVDVALEQLIGDDISSRASGSNGRRQPPTRSPWCARRAARPPASWSPTTYC